MNLYIQDTIVAQATPVGESAIGVVRLSGPLAKNILESLSPELTNQKIIPRTFYRAKITLPSSVYRLQATDLDDVLIVIFPVGHSYTGEELVEIHTHGNPLILKCLIEGTLTLGARLAEPGEFTRRAYLNGKMDLSAAEAVADLIHAKSEKALQNALVQSEGYLKNLLNQLKADLLQILSSLEAGFDFSEEDVSFFKQEEGLRLVQGIAKKIKQLVDSFSTGQFIKEGIKVVLAGAPNAGKSSLLNAVLQENRAIVHHEPGTTRDVIDGDLLYNGLLFRFFDTAGLRNQAGLVEEEGIRRAKELIIKGDLLLYLIDGSHPMTEAEQLQFQEILQLRPPTLVVITKTDLQTNTDFTKHSEFKTLKTIYLTVKQRDSINSLSNTLYDIISSQNFQSDSEYVLNNVRYKKILEDAYERTVQVERALRQNTFSEECLVEDIRQIINNFDEITGKISSEKVLDEIFSKFCIGK